MITPPVPASSASTTLSVSICRIRRRRPAPTAARTTSSRPRAGGARQQQVRDVRARDQQHERHRGEQHEQRLSRVADDDLLHRHDGDALVAVAERILLPEPRGDARHLRLRLRDRHAGRQAGRRRDSCARCATGFRARSDPGSRCRCAPDSAASVTPMIVRVRWPNVIVEPIARGSDPNCRRQYALADHDRVGVAGLLLFGREQPPGPRRRAEHAEVTGRDARHRRVVGDVVDRDAGLAAAGEIRQRLEAAALRAPVEEVRPRDRGVARARSSCSVLVTTMTRSGSSNGSGRSTTALTTLKMAVVAPMPSASVRIAVAAKPGWRIRVRMP